MTVHHFSKRVYASAFFVAFLFSYEVVAENRTQDISLTPNGCFTGELLDRSGNPVSGATLTLTDSNERKQVVVANPDGNFSFTNLSGGMYVLTTSDRVKTYRVWVHNTAPPSALDQALVIHEMPMVERGQIRNDDNRLIRKGIRGLSRIRGGGADARANQASTGRGPIANFALSRPLLTATAIAVPLGVALPVSLRNRDDEQQITDVDEQAPAS